MGVATAVLRGFLAKNFDKTTQVSFTADNRPINAKNAFARLVSAVRVTEFAVAVEVVVRPEAYVRPR
jgi:hypothetical protein